MWLWTVGFAKPDHRDLMDPQAFFLAAALALSAFILLLCIITTPRNEPTTADPRRMRITGIRIAQTRGGKTFWRGWSESTKGCRWQGQHTWKLMRDVGCSHHEESPYRIIEKYRRGNNEHCKSHQFVQLSQTELARIFKEYLIAGWLLKSDVLHGMKSVESAFLTIL
jgi:hypothetical protein